MKKLVLAVLLFAASMSAHALYLEPYPVNGEDCTMNKWPVTLINRFYVFVTNPKTGVSKILDSTADTRWTGDGVFKVGAKVTVNGTAEDFTCVANEIEVF
jgi:hypothetical protein